MVGSLEYPPPLIIRAASTHKHTAIVLHGRGSTAERFASPILTHFTSTFSEGPTSEKPFQSHFSNTKFVFPTASLRRAAAYNRSMTHQWFDMWPLDTYAPEHKQEVQLNGLKESVKYLHGLVKEAAEEVGAENVVVVGLSQGCALGLVALLLWDGARLGAFVGMCGWLPLRKSMSEALEDDNDGDGCDDGLFERAGSDSHGPEKKTKVEQAVDWLRDELNLPVEGPLNPNPKDGSPVTTPIFLGHGMEDEKVPFELGKLASQFLKELGLDVTWEEYPELAHWYSADMLTDVLGFIQSHTPSA